MIKKRYAIPALVLGLAMVGGGTVYAFGPKEFSTEAFSSFTSEEQAAIAKADTIRQNAEKEAQAVLDAAGITQDELHDAIQAYQEKQRAAVDEALEANDYSAFKALVGNNPNADKLTEEVFAKLVEIHALEKSGDREGAMKLRKELGESGFFMGPHGEEGKGPFGPRPEGAEKK